MMFQIKSSRPNFLKRNYMKIFSLLFGLALIVSVLSLTDSFVSDFFSVFFKTGDSFYKGANQIPQTFSSKEDLIDQNKILLDQLENYRLDLIDYEIVKNENLKLREILNIKPTGNFITALVIARSPQIPLDSLFLNVGTKDGVNQGDWVLAGERILIGKIVEVSKNKSTVALNSFAGMISFGFVSRTGESIELKGVGGVGMEAKVPIDFDIVVGDKILISGSFSYFAATVGALEEDKSSGFKNALLSLPVNMSKVNVVFIEPKVNE